MAPRTLALVSTYTLAEDTAKMPIYSLPVTGRVRCERSVEHGSIET